MLALLLLAGCAGNIKALYEEEKALVMADPLPVGEDWAPELRLRLSEAALQELAEVAVTEGLLAYDEVIEVDNPLGLKVEVKPKATVKKLSVAVGKDCGGCLELDAKLGGRARWSAAGSSGKVPFTAKVKGTVAFELEETPKGWTIEGRLVELDRVKLESELVGQLDLTKFLGEWTREALEEVPALELGRIGGEDLPLRAARLTGGSGSIELHALTRVSGGQSVPPLSSPLTEGWDLHLHEATALALARREAFALGTIDYDVAVDPRSLDLDAERFTMGLRLWRLSGAGWWREYTVQGDVSVGKRKIRLQPTEATEGEKSKGAGLADPLALLVEGRILEAVSDGMRQAFPGGAAARVGDRKLLTRVEAVAGEGALIRVSGGVELREGAAGRDEGELPEVPVTGVR